VSRILAVDDDMTLLQTLCLNLRARQYEMDAVATGRRALAAAARCTPDVAIVDLALPDLHGLDVRPDCAAGRRCRK
jgi:two-component system KDP operon response regulator KdpE